MRVSGLPPVLPRRAKMLIVGSIPGAASLAARRYYAHPRNAFWPIILQLLGHRPQPLPAYAARLRLLRRANIALYDVFAACVRRGSLDSAIVAGSERINDLPALLTAHPHIAVIAANGGCAARALKRHWPDLPAAVLPLPSTSPANARMNAAEKLRAWQKALTPHLPPPQN